MKYISLYLTRIGRAPRAALEFPPFVHVNVMGPGYLSNSIPRLSGLKLINFETNSFPIMSRVFGGAQLKLHYRFIAGKNNRRPESGGSGDTALSTSIIPSDTFIIVFLCHLIESSLRPPSAYLPNDFSPHSVIPAYCPRNCNATRPRYWRPCNVI